MSSYAEAAQPDTPQPAKDAVPPPAPELAHKSEAHSEKVQVSNEAPPSPPTGPAPSKKSIKNNPPLPHEQQQEEKNKNKKALADKVTKARQYVGKRASDEARKINETIQQHPIATTNIVFGITGLVAASSILAERHRAGRLDQQTGIIAGISIAIYVLADIVISRKYASS